MSPRRLRRAVPLAVMNDETTPRRGIARYRRVSGRDVVITPMLHRERRHVLSGDRQEHLRAQQSRWKIAAGLFLFYSARVPAAAGGVFPDREHFCRIQKNTRQSARLSAERIAQLAAVRARARGRALCAAMSDETIHVKGTARYSGRPATRTAVDPKVEWPRKISAAP